MRTILSVVMLLGIIGEASADEYAIGAFDMKGNCLAEAHYDDTHEDDNNVLFVPEESGEIVIREIADRSDCTQNNKAVG